MSSPNSNPPSSFSFPSQSTPSEGSILDTASTASSTSTIKPRRPLHLQPPTGINILPPSPIDASSGSSFHRIPSPVSRDNESAPVSGLGSGSGSIPRLNPNVGPYAADELSVSPSHDPSLLLSPGRTLSDDPSTNASASGSGSGSGNGNRPLGIRSPAPSSPSYRPKRTGHHRRTSSSHQVRETIDGEQKTTAEGRLVNQYRIGKSLGQGAYAKVELGVDITTGKEYAIKEYSKSRLSYQALQERQRQSTRSRLRKAQRRKDRSHWERASQKVGLTVATVISDTPISGGPWAHSEDMDEDPLGLIRREIAVMKKLDHPNIILLYEAISVPDADALFLVLEYLPGGTLMEVHVGGDTSAAKPPFPREQAREYFRQLCLGLEYLHHNEVVHRDIKPDNVLLSADRETVKLCDFGVSEMFVSQDDRIKHTGGSPAFLSPESFQSNTSDVHGKAVDIWALGVTLYCMLTGKLPFNVENPIDLFDAVRLQQPDIPKEWDRDLKDLVTRFLRKDPAQRIRMFQIRQHPWTTAHGSEEMITKDDNLYYVGQQVLEPTQEELGLAIRPLRGIFTLIRAIQKMRRLGRLRRSLSGATSGSSIPSGSMDSYATTSTVSEGASNSTSATEIDVDDADRQKALGLIYDDPHPRSQSPLSLTGESDLELDEVIDDLKLDPTAPDSPGLRETLRQGLKGLRIESRSASGSIRHHSALNSHHHHAHHPESTHRHPHHIHHLRHHLRSRRSERGDQAAGVVGGGEVDSGVSGSGSNKTKVGAGGDDGGVPDSGSRSGEGPRRRTRSRIRARYRESRDSRRSKRQSKKEQKSQSQLLAKQSNGTGNGKAPEKAEKAENPTRPRLGISTTPTPRALGKDNKSKTPGGDVGGVEAVEGSGTSSGFEITDSPVEEGDDGGFEITDSPTSASASFSTSFSDTASDTADTADLDPNEGVQIYDSPTDESEDTGIQIVDSPTEAGDPGDGGDDGFQITDSPTSDSGGLDPLDEAGAGDGTGSGAPITLMDSPSSI